MDVTIDDDLSDRISERADTVGFDSTEAYVNELLRTILNELESTSEGGEVKDRLEDLGYLDS